MAFENSLHCTDYITEKLWDNAYQSDTVPVIWGAPKADITAAVPLDSFIHADDFNSAKELADYLNYLDKNDEAYQRYFSWREDENMTDEKMRILISEKYPDVSPHAPPQSLCQRITENKKTKIIPSLANEFIKRNPKECFEHDM